LKDVGHGGMKMPKLTNRKVMQDVTKAVYLEVLKVPKVPKVMQVLEVPEEDIRQREYYRNK
jgi:hypothetical protein